MSTTPSADRKPRVARRTWLAVIAVVLLPLAYLLTWLVLSRAVNHGVVSPGVAQWIRPVYRPLILYCDLRKPGSVTLTSLWWEFTAKPEVGEQQQGWFLGPQYPTLGVDE